MRLQAAGPARDRGHQLRQPQVGAADGRQRRVMAGIRAARRALRGADAQHEGLRGGAGHPARRGRGVRRRQRSLQPEEHQLLDRREHRALPPGGRPPRAPPASRCAARSPARWAAPTRARSAPSEVERVVARLMKEIGVHHVGVADTIGVGTPRKVQAAMEAALRHYPAGRGQRPFPRHLRPGAGQHRLRRLEMGIAPSTPASPAWAAAPMPRAPPATWPPRTWSTCCTAWASTPASTSTRWSTPGLHQRRAGPLPTS
jgi:hypothetical protein